MTPAAGVGGSVVASGNREEEPPSVSSLTATLSEVADSLVCPITQSVLLDPVTAEDGHIYERRAIRDWLTRSQRSPLTKAVMGRRLFPCFHARSMIERLAHSGALDAASTAEWTQYRAEVEAVEATRRDAAAGSAAAMADMAEWLLMGARGLERDEQSWYVWALRAKQLTDSRYCPHAVRPMEALPQHEVNARMRAILLDWLVEVTEEWRLNRCVLHLAANYIDRHLAAHQVAKSRLQLLGITAMLVAAGRGEKHAFHPPEVESAVYICDGCYTGNEVREMISPRDAARVGRAIVVGMASRRGRLMTAGTFPDRCARCSASSRQSSRVPRGRWPPQIHISSDSRRPAKQASLTSET